MHTYLTTNRTFSVHQIVVKENSLFKEQNVSAGSCEC